MPLLRSPNSDSTCPIISLLDLNDIVYYHLAEAKTAQELLSEVFLSENAKKRAIETEVSSII